MKKHNGQVHHPVHAMIVAGRILRQRHLRGQSTTTLDLIKLTYIAHGWFLGIYGVPLIEEVVEAWKYGPVIPIVYERFQSYRGEPIDLVPEDNSRQMSRIQLHIIDQTVQAYASYDTWSLSAITHKPGTPWDKVTKARHSRIISNDLIQRHYADLCAQHNVLA